MWGCMSTNGVGSLKVVDGRLDSAKYVGLISNSLKDNGRRLYGENFLFQQDGATCHTARRTIAWFERHGIKSDSPLATSVCGSQSHRASMG